MKVNLEKTKVSAKAIAYAAVAIVAIALFTPCRTSLSFLDEQIYTSVGWFKLVPSLIAAYLRVINAGTGLSHPALV